MKVCVIGGGPAGMLASFSASSQGTNVFLIEKNEKLGRKIYITGKGRCNVTNIAEYDEFLNNIVINSKFMMSSLKQFSNTDAMNFIESNGTKLKTERGGRVFPVSDKASDITKALTKACEKAGVNFVYDFDVNKIENKGDGFVLISKSGLKIECDRLVITTGGISYKPTGSTGDGHVFASQFGHSVTPLLPALVPIKVSNSFVSKLEGLSLKNVELCANIGDKFTKFFGEMLFTNDGISGPIALSMSSYINKCDSNEISLSIDFKPALDHSQLDSRIQRDFLDNLNCNVSKVVDGLLPKRLSDVFLEVAGISPTRKVNSITKEERQDLVSTLKHFELKFNGLYPIDCAIITSGGVSAKEISPKTMESKFRKNLFFAGEVVDVDCLTGGFNIQCAMSMGYVAGLNAGKME